MALAGATVVGSVAVCQMPINSNRISTDNNAAFALIEKLAGFFMI